MDDPPIAVTKVTGNNSTSVPQPVRQHVGISTGDHVGWDLIIDSEGNRRWCIRLLSEEEVEEYRERGD